VSVLLRIRDGSSCCGKELQASWQGYDPLRAVSYGLGATDREAFGDQPDVFFAALCRSMDAKINVFAADDDASLTRRLKKAI
jgi:hypothetical protein